MMSSACKRGGSSDRKADILKGGVMSPETLAGGQPSQPRRQKYLACKELLGETAKILTVETKRYQEPLTTISRPDQSSPWVTTLTRGCFDLLSSSATQEMQSVPNIFRKLERCQERKEPPSVMNLHPRAWYLGDRQCRHFCVRSKFRHVPK